MKRLALMGIGTAFAAMLAVPVLASTIQHGTVEARVPFSFHVGQVTLPPGDYVVQQVSDLSPDVLEIRSRDSRHVALFMAADGTDGSGLAVPSFVFDRVGSESYLRAIWVGGRSGAVLPTPPGEGTDVVVTATGAAGAAR
ncbi:MAG TPA: hypothetical protein VMX54_04855 [Vicinamibacteria bacterium]|nr:hypothetical protein [Vicinamibacteria bacterium]